MAAHGHHPLPTHQNMDERTRRPNLRRRPDHRPHHQSRRATGRRKIRAPHLYERRWQPASRRAATSPSLRKSPNPTSKSASAHSTRSNASPKTACAITSRSWKSSAPISAKTPASRASTTKPPKPPAPEQAAKASDAAPSEPEDVTKYLPLRADIQTALTILGRRSKPRRDHEATHRPDKPYRLDLRHCHLQNADLTDAALGPALLNNTDLKGAYLISADLKGADLDSADLKGASSART